MEVILVRHGESQGNAERRMQGRLDFSLTERGQAQAACAARWLEEQGIVWSHAMVSPLSRARETYAIIERQNSAVAPEYDDELQEIHAGCLEGLTTAEIEAEYPDFVARDVTEIGDYRAFGGESYAAVQARVDRVIASWQTRFRETGETVLALSHGGFLYQLVKAAICVPVPRVAILRFSNCTLTKLYFREHRRTYMAEVTWHVPVDLMVGKDSDALPVRAGEGVRHLF